MPPPRVVLSKYASGRVRAAYVLITTAYVLVMAQRIIVELTLTAGLATASVDEIGWLHQPAYS